MGGIKRWQKSRAAWRGSPLDTTKWGGSEILEQICSPSGHDVGFVCRIA